MIIEKAHLYVEKYSRTEREMLLDFVREDEFIYFRNRGDYAIGMRLPENQYEPTMLLLHNCASMPIREGAILTVDMEKLLELRENYNDGNQANERPATVFLEISDGASFTDLILNIENSITNYVDKETVFYSGPLWPCALDATKEPFQLNIWNVGQGNTNSISDQNNLTLFDFGASLYYSASQLKAIIRDHLYLFDGKKRVSLIISHWDSDHCNLLCVADAALLQKICCVFFPPEIITLTAKQAVARIKAYCKYQVAIPPARRAIPRKCGIQEVHRGSRYILFTGETCKDLNKSGLLLTLCSETAMAFLTADHSSYQVWDKMYTSVAINDKKLHVVVPHHGGNCGKVAVRSAAHPGIAAVSVGSNGYGHPWRKVLDMYRRAHYNVIRTDRCGHDIIIHM